MEKTVQSLLDAATTLIAHMDERDGDPDLEPCLKGDTPCRNCPLIDCECEPEDEQ